MNLFKKIRSLFTKTQAEVIHDPIADIAHFLNIHKEVDGVECNYVCTTDIQKKNVPVDILYRPTPNPKFGNHYFGIGRMPLTNKAFIMNADVVEELTFLCVLNDEQRPAYSRHKDEELTFANGNFVKGGRHVPSASDRAAEYVVRGGKMIRKSDA